LKREKEEKLRIEREKEETEKRRKMLNSMIDDVNVFTQQSVSQLQPIPRSIPAIPSPIVPKSITPQIQQSTLAIVHDTSSNIRLSPACLPPRPLSAPKRLLPPTKPSAMNASHLLPEQSMNKTRLSVDCVDTNPYLVSVGSSQQSLLTPDTTSTQTAFHTPATMIPIQPPPKVHLTQAPQKPVEIVPLFQTPNRTPSSSSILSTSSLTSSRLLRSNASSKARPKMTSARRKRLKRLLRIQESTPTQKEHRIMPSRRKLLADAVAILESSESSVDSKSGPRAILNCPDSSSPFSEDTEELRQFVVSRMRKVKPMRNRKQRWKKEFEARKMLQEIHQEEAEDHNSQLWETLSSIGEL